VTKKFNRRTAVINKPGTPTHGETCQVEKFKEELGKFEVYFDNLWVGWYREEELIFSTPTRDLYSKALELKQCAKSWDPDARLLGNVKASEIVAILNDYTSLRLMFIPVEDRQSPHEGSMEDAFTLHVDPDDAFSRDCQRERKNYYWKNPEGLYTSGKPKDLVDLFV